MILPIECFGRHETYQTPAYALFGTYNNETKSISTLLSPQNADIVQNVVKGDSAMYIII